MGQKTHNHRSATSILVAAVVAIGSASVASAQTATKPVTAPAGAQVVTPYWNQKSPEAAQAPAAPAIPQNADQLLAATVQAVPQARADAVVARWTYRRLEGDLTRQSSALRRDFMESAEYTKAVDDLKAAHAAYDRARADAIKGVQSTDDYTAVMSLRNGVASQIADEHDQSRPDGDRLIALAELKLSYMAPVRSLERELLDGNANVRSARERLLTAASDVRKLEREFGREARDSIELASLRRMREDAKINAMASAAYLLESRIARNIAINYAFYSRSVDRYIPRFGYGGYDGYSGYRGGYGGFGTYGGVGSVYPVGLGIQSTLSTR